MASLWGWITQERKSNVAIAEPVDFWPDQSNANNDLKAQSIRLDQPVTSSLPIESYFGSARSRKQFSFFAASAAFLLLSASITRRALNRKRLQGTPQYYQPSNSQTELKVHGPLEALEALQLATLNATSFMMTLGFGTLWAFDISSLDDLRRKVRGGLGVDGTGRSEQDVEEQVEEWIATALSRQESKKEKSIINTIEPGLLTATDAKGRLR